MEIKKELADYLSKLNWDGYFTSTSKQHQRYSGTAIERVHKILFKGRLRPTKMFIVAEQHMLGGWHTHGLVEYPDYKIKSMTREKMESLLNSSNSAMLSKLGFNRVRQVIDKDACSLYLAKYLTKNEINGDWRMYGRKKFWQQHL